MPTRSLTVHKYLLLQSLCQSADLPVTLAAMISDVAESAIQRYDCHQELPGL